MLNSATVKKSEWHEHIGDNHNPDNVDGELLKTSLHICLPRQKDQKNDCQKILEFWIDEVWKLIIVFDTLKRISASRIIKIKS